MQPLRASLDETLQTIPGYAERYRAHTADSQYYGEARIHQALEGFFTNLLQYTGQPMLVAEYTRTPVFQNDKEDPSGLHRREWKVTRGSWDHHMLIEEQQQRTIVARLDDAAYDEPSRSVVIGAKKHLVLDAYGGWNSMKGGFSIDVDSLLHQYEMPQHGMFHRATTPQGRSLFRFAFGRDIRWCFQMNAERFWHMLGRSRQRGESELAYKLRFERHLYQRRTLQELPAIVADDEARYSRWRAENKLSQLPLRKPRKTKRRVSDRGTSDLPLFENP